MKNSSIKIPALDDWIIRPPPRPSPIGGGEKRKKQVRAARSAARTCFFRVTMR